ncbi:phosphotransferase [Trichlorobacter ammonificans]|uniref:Aminoglycoside phosphotransferase domain-containing protein n=1 Tax=Trichlorobacter ammonificans TaxID=2916410 RepID=A0ABN8HEV6_9BACT|nr:phosphotransferase [Trichlorobacter ammonificans]CAH2031396.1 conserved protein of unknown function [Trichlorobacter ammonificans]
MTLSQLERNLLVFLDPTCRWGEDAWAFGEAEQPATTEDGPRHRVRCFGRSDLLGYLRCSLAAGLTARREGATVRRVLYLNDGLLSSLFDSRNSSGYRAFARAHLPRPQGIRRRLATLIPPFWRAERRFVVTEQRGTPYRPPVTDRLEELDYMFFSNPAGKLMLTRAATLVSGSGTLYKTTASPGYIASLQHEQAIVTGISRRLREEGLLHGPVRLLAVGGRRYFGEQYLSGENLREVLRLLGREKAGADACLMLDRLDLWFATYRSAFSGSRRSISCLYEPMLRTFAALPGRLPGHDTLLQLARSLLAGLDRNHGGIVPVTAHNDLWPGNFLLRGGRLTAIDWERSTHRSTPFFDYFWMIISATMEYLVGSSGSQDYSTAFRRFLTQDDIVCRHAVRRLEQFLADLGFERTRRPQFMLLFLMEWSLQGFRALGRVTAMDRLAQDELAAYLTVAPSADRGTFS